MQTAVTAKKPGNTAFSGRFRTGRIYRGRIKDDHKIDRAMGWTGFLIDVIELLGLRRWEFPCTRHFERVETMAPPPHSLL